MKSYRRATFLLLAAGIVACDARGGDAGAHPGDGGAEVSDAGQRDVERDVEPRSLGEGPWSFRFGAGGWDGGTAIALDSVGNVFVAGSVSGGVDFGRGEIAPREACDSFVAKYSSDGRNR